MRWWACLSGAALALCALSLGMIFTRSSPESYDAQIMFQVTQSMVDHGTFTVHQDPFGVNTPYSYYGIGMSLLMAVPYWVAERLHQSPGAFVMGVNAAVVSATAATIFALGLATRATAVQSLAAAGLTVFGTLLLPYVATGFSEPSVALAIALGLLAVQTNRPVLAGAAAGFALLMRIDSAFLVAPVLGAAAWLAGARSWQSALRFSAALMPAVIVMAAYDTLRFGAPWRVGYSFATFNHPFAAGLYGLLLSPAAGLFIYVPLLPVALAGLLLTMRRLPLLASTALVLLAVRVLVYAAWFGWSAYWAWGPRYLVPRHARARGRPDRGVPALVWASRSAEGGHGFRSSCEWPGPGCGSVGGIRPCRDVQRAAALASPGSRSRFHSRPDPAKHAGGLRSDLLRLVALADPR